MCGQRPAHWCILRGARFGACIRETFILRFFNALRRFSVGRHRRLGCRLVHRAYHSGSKQDAFFRLQFHRRRSSIHYSEVEVLARSPSPTNEKETTRGCVRLVDG